MSSFFKRWNKGIKNYRNSPLGDLEVKIVFMSVVVVGLFGGSVQYLVNGNVWMFLVLFGFGVVMLVDLKNLFKARKQFVKSLEVLRK